MRFAGEEAAGAEGLLADVAGEEVAAAAVADAPPSSAFANCGGGAAPDRAVLSSATAGPQQRASRGRRLMYTKSGERARPPEPRLTRIEG